MKTSLSDADNILYLDGGKQLEFGSFDKVMRHESKFIQSLQKAKDDTESNTQKNKSPCHNENNNEKLELKKEARATGEIGFSDFVYFLRACGSNSGLFSL